MMSLRGMWDDLLIVFSSDNGGPVYFSGAGGANNFPNKVKKRSF
jgi:arylsulfatase A-like enzyme